ncbi:hypothetical protein [Arthrobacter koreensis]|uniref:hypothetical protein n=1 Tax=Arthrobacter koreensis TaxID=199136 RepID=UPI0037FD0A26
MDGDKKKLSTGNRRILTGALAVLLAAGGLGAVVWQNNAPMSDAENLQKIEEEYGKAPAIPTVEEVDERLVEFEERHGEEYAAPVSGDGAGPEVAPGSDVEAWQEYELLRQQREFAEAAPEPMPTGVSHTVTASEPQE